MVLGVSNVLDSTQSIFRRYESSIRFCLRVTLAGMLAFCLAQLLGFPLRGLWAVLTAIVVTQVGGGASISAVIEYATGTLAGAIYAGTISILIPHTTMLTLAGVLALAIAPLAMAAALNPMFRIAPFTAAIVLLVSAGFQESPIESAVYRVLEVMLGGVSVIAVSFMIQPEQAHGRGIRSAILILQRLSQLLPQLIAGFSHPLGAERVLQLQEGLGSALVDFELTAAETRLEHRTYPHHAPDLSPLSRTLLRLRHDLVIVGRAATNPLPDAIIGYLNAPLAELSKSVSALFDGCAVSLGLRHGPPQFDAVDAAFAEYERAFAAVRTQGLMEVLPNAELERLFALTFGIEQLWRNLRDLQRCVRECSEAIRQTAAGR